MFNRWNQFLSAGFSIVNLVIVMQSDLAENSSFVRIFMQLILMLKQTSWKENWCSAAAVKFQGFVFILSKDGGSGGSPPHVKFVLEWDMPAKSQVINDDRDYIEEHSSVKLVQKSPEEASSVSLQECFGLYTKVHIIQLYFCIQPSYT